MMEKKHKRRERNKIKKKEKKRNEEKWISLKNKKKYVTNERIVVFNYIAVIW